MNMISIKYLSSFITLILIIYSCGIYSLKGTIPAHIKSIYIKPIFNKSIDHEIVELLDVEFSELLLENNILEITNNSNADSELEIIILDVTNSPYTVDIGTEYEVVEEWKIAIKVQIGWYDLKNGVPLFESTITEWGVYGNSIDISDDKLDNDGDGLIDGEDSDEIGSPLESARLIASKKIAEQIIHKITSTW